MHIVMILLQLFALLCAPAAVSAESKPASYKALASQYHDQHPGKGKYAEYWDPIPIQKYWNPKDFYTPPATVTGKVTRESCVECHQAVTPGAYQAWQQSTHAHLDELRKLQDSHDVRAYKKGKLVEIERNLLWEGVLKENQTLNDVSCIDCHGEVGASAIEHDKDLKMPDRATCGRCHTQEFAEAESEKDQEWPQAQWGKGHPSHAVDWHANVETAVWAAMPQREIAQGCDMCHYQQNKCDGCHTRHTFSAAEARQPEACATCHNGADHNEFENYLTSKHGTVYQTQGKSRWNFEAPLKDALTQGHYTAPTCQTCHFEFNGEYSHNLVRKVRWAFNPTPAIADNLKHPWFENRKQAWIDTCAACHSNSFADAYLTAADQGTISGLAVEQEAKKVVEALHKEGLLPGQRTNRPAPPKPESDAPGGFFQLFWARGNNPTMVERTYADMWEHDLIKLYKGLFHGNPGGFTYTEGWSELLRDYAIIMDEDTRLRAAAKTSGLPSNSFAKAASLFQNGTIPGDWLYGGTLVGVGTLLVRRKR